jgi:hypothetical protein
MSYGKVKYFLVLMLDLYEWNWEQVHYKIHKYESKLGRICPTKGHHVERFLEKKGQGMTKNKFHSSCNE